jgi:hypothetical protein
MTNRMEEATIRRQQGANFLNMDWVPSTAIEVTGSAQFELVRTPETGVCL